MNFHLDDLVATNTISNIIFGIVAQCGVLVFSFAVFPGVLERALIVSLFVMFNVSQATLATLVIERVESAERRLWRDALVTRFIIKERSTYPDRIWGFATEEAEVAATADIDKARQAARFDPERRTITSRVVQDVITFLVTLACQIGLAVWLAPHLRVWALSLH